MVRSYDISCNQEQLIGTLRRGQIVQHYWFNILLISTSLNNNKEVVGKKNDTEPTMLSNLTPVPTTLCCCEGRWSVVKGMLHQGLKVKKTQ